MYFEQAHLMSKEKKVILLPKTDAAHSEEGHMPSTVSVSSCHERLRTSALLTSPRLETGAQR